MPDTALNKNELQTFVGSEVRACRRKRELTLTELASSSQLSIASISKIEHGMISPSLASLQTISGALGVPISSLLHRFEKRHEAVFTKAEQKPGSEQPSTNTNGSRSSFVGGTRLCGPELSLEPTIFQVTELEKDVTLSTDRGVKFLYMLDGEAVYRCGLKQYHLLPGDSIIFKASVQHGFVELITAPISYLSVLSRRP